ncbi:MAG: Tat pathway signal protein [Acidobacteria bacterium]|nr:MAG: Tat pathway signal protein [Acidobacteriota bacterium]
MTRRSFLRNSLASAVLVGAGRRADGQSSAPPPHTPWYRRAYLWGQTNITEKDPVRYDIAWWREYWKRTQTQAVIINAGGIVAYYPSKFPLHHRAEFLGGRDLFGELTKAAHDDGLFVMARMDSNRAAEDFFKAHPDWFARDSEGNPYRAADKYIACINSAYYDEYLPGVLREIIERSHPDGFTDNSWAGLGRESICFCANCDRTFRAKTAKALPRTAAWDDPVYRQWIMWSYARRIEVWEVNNRITREAGGPDCIWSGMNSGSITAEARSFRDLKEICRRADIMMLDHQRRDDDTGFQQNGDTGKRVHGVLGWDKLAPESMAMYQSGPGYYRVASKPAAEARMWMIAGVAGGIQPWWHHVGAYHEDRRMYHTAEPVMRWWKANEQYLINRQPVATVGVVWSQRNTDFFGRDDAADRVDAPYTGFMHALVRARIPYLPVHIDDIEQQRGALSVLILPNVGALSNAQAASIGRFVEHGGSLVATGHTGLYDEWGDPRSGFALADLFACHRIGETPRLQDASSRRGSGEERGAFAPGPSGHTYLRLRPELRARVDGPKAGDEPAPTGERHAVLQGFDETDILPFGGTLSPLKVDAAATVPLTFVPAFPTYPPETSWMRQPTSDIPGLILSQHGSARVAYIPADIDRRYAREHLPDHFVLLANIVRWAADRSLTLRVEGPGLVDCHLYEQSARMILHIVNLTSEATWRAPVDELIKVGPFKVALRLPQRVTGRTARLLVSAIDRPVAIDGGIAVIEIESILDHEVLVIG